MNKLEGQLKKFVVDEYKPYSGDLFSVFMYKNFNYCKVNGYCAFMTPFVWMFIKTYEQLREYIIQHKSITTLIQMEYSAFEEATVPICTFVLKNGNEATKGLYIKLSDFKGGMDIQKCKVLEALETNDCRYVYETSASNFLKISSSPISFWASNAVLNSYEKGEPLSNVAETRQGMASSDDSRFVRIWHEVYLDKIGFNMSSSEEAKASMKKWFPYNKGGSFRKWAGNNSYVINYENDGFEVKEYASSLYKSASRTIKSTDVYFREGATWSAISSGSLSVRWFDKGYVISNAGMALYANSKSELLYLLAVLNSKVNCDVLIKVLNESLNFNAGDISRIPVIFDNQDTVIELANENVKIALTDWNSFETSWNFNSNPLIKSTSIKTAFENWEVDCDKRFNTMKSNEEELNSIFIEIYKLNEELDPNVNEEDIAVRKADFKRDIKNFISYAVGCMFGRYSLDEDGIIYAGGKWEETKYSKFIPDKDNVIPVTDEEYFEDDIVGLFIVFVKKVYGEESLEENLEFIANALGNKGNTSREIIRNYFVKDFYKDHLKIYQKRPIYWMYDSGKNDGFKALIYMHRYNEDTTGIVRVDYLHKMQKIYVNEIDRMQEMVDNSADSREIAQAEKRKEKLVKQLKETKEYDGKIAHLAVSRIAIDLDDGVKVNYEKIQTGQDGKKLDILGKI